MGMIEVDESRYIVARRYAVARFKLVKSGCGRDEVLVSLVWGKPVLAACDNRTRFLVCEEVACKLAFKED